MCWIVSSAHIYIAIKLAKASLFSIGTIIASLTVSVVWVNNVAATVF